MADTVQWIWLAILTVGLLIQLITSSALMRSDKAQLSVNSALMRSDEAQQTLIDDLITRTS